MKRRFKSNLNTLALIAITCFTWGSCQDPEPEPDPSDLKPGAGVFVMHEGTFMTGTAGLYYLNLQNDSLDPRGDLFRSANNRPLGDVFQSLSIIDGRLWMVVNNSGKIEISDPRTMLSFQTISGLRSPRYAIEADANKVYVSDLYENALSVIDKTQMKKTGEIVCRGWTEAMVKSGNEVWVTNHDSKFLYSIQTATDRISDSIELAWGGSSILKDQNGFLWVLCSGDLLKKKTGGLFRVDPVTHTVNRSILFSDPAFNPVGLCLSKNGDSLLFLSSGVYRMSAASDIIPSGPWIPQASGSTFYGLALEPTSGRIFVADAKDFNSRGYVLIYSAGGLLQKKLRAGIVPSGFYFW